MADPTDTSKPTEDPKPTQAAPEQVGAAPEHASVSHEHAPLPEYVKPPEYVQRSEPDIVHEPIEAVAASEPEPVKPEPTRGFLRKKSLRSASEAIQPEAPPPPPPPRRKKPRRTGTLSLISGFLSFLLIACLGAAFGLSLAQQKVRSAGPLAADKVLYFPPRTEVPEILAQLEREGVIDSPMLMNVSLWLEGNRGNVKAGEYLFKREASMRDVIDLLVSGRQLLHSITVPEGLTSEQIVQRLRDNDVLAGELRESPKEGVILPETYRVPRGMSRSDLMRKMQDDQRKLVEQIWAKRDPSLPLRTPYEMVTLASIVEKETGKADERPRVAAVFINRLQKRMRLQSDPTIVYGIVGGKGTLGRGITRDEISRRSAYNTYVIDGLPPGPIANPGRAALEAVANPAKTKDLYFVADGTGGHTFAESLDEHSRNVARWRQLERDKAAGAADVDRAPAVVPGDPGVPNLTPSNVAPPRGQRGALELPGPGHALVDALPRMAGFDLTAKFGPKGWAPSGPPPATVLAQRINEARKLAANKGGGLFSNFTFESGAERVAIRGLTDRPQLDGDESDFDMGRVEGGVNDAAYPLSPGMLADQRARAAKYGVGGGAADLGGLPPEALALQALPRATAKAHMPIFDASEGTPLDPLKDKKWDLTSAKDVKSSLRSATSAIGAMAN
jgi:UPF0755 protein